MANFKDIDTWRKGHLAVAEWVDSWRMIPRLMVAGYAFMMWEVVKWYMTIEPKVIANCDIATLGEVCIAAGPSTQHAALVTAVVGIAAAVFGLYTSSGKKDGSGFQYWTKEKKIEENK